MAVMIILKLSSESDMVCIFIGKRLVISTRPVTSVLKRLEGSMVELCHN